MKNLISLLLLAALAFCMAPSEPFNTGENLVIVDQLDVYDELVQSLVVMFTLAKDLEEVEISPGKLTSFGMLDESSYIVLNNSKSNDNRQEAIHLQSLIDNYKGLTKNGYKYVFVNRRVDYSEV